jgi:hypothetical protein
MAFNLDDATPPNREYPVRDEESRSDGVLGFILIAAICVGLFYMLDNRPTYTASSTPNQIETTGSVPTSALPVTAPGRDCTQAPDPQVCQ